MKDAQAQLFSLRAMVYDTSESKRKKVFETPINEGIQLFTASLQPKQNITVPVKVPGK
jgi:hypothetical protein